jgi:hypothetical protein
VSTAQDEAELGSPFRCGRPQMTVLRHVLHQGALDPSVPLSGLSCCGLASAPGPGSRSRCGDTRGAAWRVRRAARIGRAAGSDNSLLPAHHARRDARTGVPRPQLTPGSLLPVVRRLHAPRSAPAPLPSFPPTFPRTGARFRSRIALRDAAPRSAPRANRRTACWRGGAGRAGAHAGSGASEPLHLPLGSTTHHSAHLCARAQPG